MTDRHRGEAAAVEAADATLRRVISDAYNRGFKDGAADMHAKLAQFLAQHERQPPVAVERQVPAAQSASAKPDGKRIPSRAIRDGSIPDFLRRNLPGIKNATPAAIHRDAALQGRQFTLDAIRTELMRWRDVRYERDGGGHWFLIGAAKKETAEEALEAASADHQPETEGGRLGTAPLI